MVSKGNSMYEKHPLVSVIIPSYNSANYILDTIRDLEKQKFSDFEIVVINDGSLDNTLAILEEEQKTNSRLKVLDKVNGGVSSARNAGIKHAKGQFISFLDDDDKLHPDFIQEMYSRQKLVNANAIYCGMTGYTGRKIKEYREIPTKFYEGSILQYFINKEIKFHIGCLFLKRSYLLENNLYFDERLRIGEDLLYIYGLLASTPMFSVPYFMYHHIYRAGSLMNKQRTLKHYQHELYAHEIILSHMSSVLAEDNREDILLSLKVNVLYHQIRFMWKLLLAGKFHELNKSLNDCNIKLNNNGELLRLDKRTQKRARILRLRNKLIWRIVWLINLAK